MMYGLGDAILVIASCIIISLVLAEIYDYIKNKRK